MIRAVLVVALAAAAAALPAVPKASAVHSAGNTAVYIADAIVSLPYYATSENVRVYFDQPNKRSRTDYYGGQDVYIHNQNIGQFGASFQVVPTTFSGDTVITSCFQINGTQPGDVTLQGVLPDISDFVQTNETMIAGLAVNVWTYQNKQGSKVNTYNYYVTKVGGIPVRYHMEGYDSLYGSHYDEYVIDYIDFRADVTIDPIVFTPPKSVLCGDFPGPGDAVKAHTRGALSFLDEEDLQEKKLHSDFEEFKQKHGKSYESDVEHVRRKDAFRQNVRFINSVNRKKLSYTLAVNHLADLLPHEHAVMRGSRSSPRQPEEEQSVEAQDLPVNFDWRDKGAVSTVKDQGICGSCWSFSTAESIESAWYLSSSTSYMVPLSQQALMDCSWGFGNNACDGGEAFRAYGWVLKTGFIPTQATYGIYEMADGACHYNAPNVEKGPALSGYVNLTSGDVDNAKAALFAKGPLAVAIDASQPTFSFYSSGVYFDPNCKNDPDGLDHAVLAVGFGHDPASGQDYWLVKNSWSDHWGDQGYVKMSTKENNCGVATDAHYPIIKK